MSSAAGEPEPEVWAPLPAEPVLRSLCHALRGHMSRLYLRIELAELPDSARTAMFAELHAMEAVMALHRDLLLQAPEDAPETLSLSAVASDVVHALRLPDAVRLDASLELRVRAWRQPLAAALRALLLNAAQHGASPIVLSAEPSATHITLVCADAGQGFDPALLAVCREPFVHVPQGPHRGSGLGLALVQRMASQLGARLDVERAPTSFRVLLRGLSKAPTHTPD